MLESLHGAAGATMMIACHEGIHAMKRFVLPRESECLFN